MSKPYLSLIIPVTEETLRDSMLSIMNADHLFQGAAFDYEILIVTPESDVVSRPIIKFTGSILNAKCVQVPEYNISGLIRSGLTYAHGVLRAYAFKNDFSFLEQFDHMIPHFKEQDVVVGPLWSLSSTSRTTQAVAALIHSPYQFQIIKEDVVPIVCSKTFATGWEFFAETYTRLLIAGINTKVAKEGTVSKLKHSLDLQLFKGALTMRIHYLYIRMRRLFDYLGGKFLSLFRN